MGLRPCRSPYCECEQDKCTHPGCYDARGVKAPHPGDALGRCFDCMWTGKLNCPHVGVGASDGKTAPAVQLYTAEALEVHRLLDEAGVPRTADTLPLSMSQRVAEALRLMGLMGRATVQTR